MDTPNQKRAKIFRLIGKRRREGYSLERLAQETGVALATMSRWARGESKPHASRLDVVLTALRELG